MRNKQIGWLMVMCLTVALLLGPVMPQAQCTPVINNIYAPDKIFFGAPAPGDTLTAGSQVDIMWYLDVLTLKDYVNFALSYTTDNGATYQTITSGTKDTYTNNDRYTWTVPNISAPKVQIKIAVTVPAGFMTNDVYYNLSGEFAIKKPLIIIEPDLPDIKPILLIPAAPADLTGKALSANSVELEWEDKSSNETGFIIERKGPGMASYQEIATVNANVTTYTDTGLTEGNEYTYRVCASNKNGESAFAGPVTVKTKVKVMIPISKLSAPTELKADSVTDTRVILSWQDNSDIESGFSIERAAGSGTYKELATVAEDITGYTDSSVIQGQTYSYRVRAFTGNENSEYSNTVTANITAAEPKPPINTSETTLRFTIGESIYFWNDISQAMDVAPIIKEGRTLLPVRYVADPLGAQVLWNEIERKVSIKTASKTIELWIDNNTASVNGQKLLIDPNNPNVMPIVIPPGRTMLPLRFIADNLDCNVDWNDLTREVTVTWPK